MGGMGRGLGLRVHGHSMHGDALTLASFDVILDWVGKNPSEVGKNSAEEGFVMVTRKHRRPEVKILTIKNQPTAPNRKPSPNNPTPAITQPQPRNPAQPKPLGKKVIVQKPQAVSSQPFVSRDELKGFSTSGLFAVLDVDMSDVDKNIVIASDDGDMSESDKFYEFSSESIANVLHFNPSKLTVPRLHDQSPDPDDPVIMDVACDDEIPDFNITNAQKQAISNSLVKYGAVKADDQVPAIPEI
ncbi:hypothetical protein L1987_86996 [Smallanthus sonchifolius]|uniref:Uncharacterized protein n=1 Tax=Smallanthus sonchifolius TaxID=185202 RepID=A0ACB8Y0T9_9ASTR|nr:hypothetical protein L1987_86996 [Smallanthus sonchifolius]